MPHPSSPPLTGVDITDVARLAQLLERRPELAERCFTAAERRDCRGRPERWASTWAAKEAVRKLAAGLGRSPLPAFAAIEVVRRPGGPPTVRVAGLPPVAMSLSHDGGLALAVAVAVPSEWPALLGDHDRGLVLPARPADGHKGTFGTVAVVAGSHGFTGAARLAATGAARGGAGRVRLGVPASLHPLVAPSCLEVMAHPLPDDGDGVLVPAAVPVVRDRLLAGADVLVVGPGLGLDARTGAALAELVATSPCALVVDADGLTLGARLGFEWTAAGRPVVLTPHPAEMARLLGSDTAAVQVDREATASSFARERGVVLVLKGAGTVIAAPDGRLAVDRTVTPALATGGTGDVLAGLVGAFVAGGLDAFEAARAAVAVHGEAGLQLEAVRGRAGSLAGDLLDILPAAQERIRRWCMPG